MPDDIKAAEPVAESEPNPVAEPVYDEVDGGADPAEPNLIPENIGNLTLATIKGDEEGTFENVLSEIYQLLAVGSAPEETINDLVPDKRKDAILALYTNTAKRLKAAYTAIDSIILKWIRTWEQQPGGSDEKRRLAWWSTFEVYGDYPYTWKMAIVSNGCACSACYHSAAACCVCQRAYPRGRRAAYSVFRNYENSGIRT